MKKLKTIFIERYMVDQAQKFRGWSQTDIIKNKRIHKHRMCHQCCQPIIEVIKTEKSTN